MILIFKWIRKKMITIYRNEQKIYPNIDFILEPEDKIILPKTIDTRPKKIDDRFIHYIDKSILFQNEDFLILNKPTNLASQGGNKNIYSLADYYDYKNYYLIHRLDKPTSGSLIVGKTLEYSRYLHNLFKEKKINKTYICAFKGNLKSQTINNIHGHSIFNVIEPGIAKVNIITGKKHQIRKHLADNKCYIWGDNLYTDDKNKYTYFMLHSWKISWESWSFISPLPKYWCKFIDQSKL